MAIIKFLIILLILISVHELGHFLFAKLFRVYVSEFALGFGPKIYSRKGKETEFSIRLLPLGGFAAMVGEEEIAEEYQDLPKERTLKGVNRFKQFLIMFGGAFFNIILAFIIFMGISATTNTVNPVPIIGNVVADSPAQKAGLQVNDRVIRIEQDNKSTRIRAYTDLAIFSQFNTEGKAYTMIVKRDNEEVSLDITPIKDKKTNTYIAGFSPTMLEATSNPLNIIKNGFLLTADSFNTMISSLKIMFSGKAGLNDLSGPVGMVAMTDQVQKSGGFVGLLGFMAFLSMNLAVLNLLPIPALDGGRIVFLVIESIMRRPLNQKVEAMLINISFILLMILIVVVFFNDIIKLFR